MNASAPFQLLYKGRGRLVPSILALLLLTQLLPAQEPALPDERVVLVPWSREVKEAPLFFSADADVHFQVGLQEITSEQTLHFRILQGKAETLTLDLTGDGDVISVTGEGLRDWAIRVSDDGTRHLDVRPLQVDGKAPAELTVIMKTQATPSKDLSRLLLPQPGAASGFSIDARLISAAGVVLKVSQSDGLRRLAGDDIPAFAGTGNSVIGIQVLPAGNATRGLDLQQATLTGNAAKDGGSVSFRLTGTARSDAAGSSVPLLSGVAALTDGVTGDGWHVSLKKGDKDEAWSYDLVADRSGEFPINLAFDIPVQNRGDWREVDFHLPAGVVVPLTMEGLANGVSFDASKPVVPESSAGIWRGFLPADGRASFAWKAADKVADGALFFSSTETTDVRVGSGLLRQMTVLDLRVLQGRLPQVQANLTGPGEILSVAGNSVLGWKVAESEGARRLEIQLSRPIESSERIIIESQSALAGFPVKAEALRMSVAGSLRHNGWLRVANDGAVRVEVTEAKGLIQLVPSQFPGGEDKKLRQVFVYRFPSADYQYGISANQILPEVGLTEVTIYELAETDRRIVADLELDIREAPLREWQIKVPEDHAVSAVSGAEVADYALATEAVNGMRELKVIFKQAVFNRQLISVKLEKNEAAKAGSWTIQPLVFPNVKSRRGFIGISASAGYRLTSGASFGLVDVPVTFFPKKSNNLQQAFRLRENEWSVSANVELLGQNVQADVFHLYSLKSGAVSGSVLFNYFVVGAPSSEWRISIPKGIGNIDVTGQNVGRDWRREGDTVIVPLSSPLTGTATLLLTFDQAMEAGGGTIAPGTVRPLGVQGERGFVQVVSPLQVKHQSSIDGSLVAIDASEVPTEFRLLSTAPTLGAWQYTGREFNISMDVDWFETGDTVHQVVDFEKLSSHVSRDGQWVTDARIFVKTRGRSTLRMSLPPGAVLWEAKVNGETVNAQIDGAHTLVPLPLQTNPNEAAEISFRYGAQSADENRPRLVAPRLDVPVLIGEWSITGDEGRRLVPRGGTADLVAPVLAESGWEWLGRNRGGVLALLFTALTAIALMRRNTGGIAKSVALFSGVLFVVMACYLGVSALNSSRAFSSVLQYAAPVVASDTEISVELGNVPLWQAGTGWSVWLGFLAGSTIALSGFLKRDRWWLGSGLVLVIASFLSIRGGASLFLGIIAMVGMTWLLPAFIRTWKCRHSPFIAAMMVLVFVLSNRVNAADELTEIMKPAESMIHDWQIREGRLYGSIDVTVRGEEGDRFLLLRDPAVLGSFEGDGLKLVKMQWQEKNTYALIAGRAGLLTGRAVFEMPLSDPMRGWELPGGPAAMRRITVKRDQSGWEFTSPGAARTQVLENLKANESGALLVLGPQDPVIIQSRLKQRDAGSEQTRFYAQTSQVFIPGPGVVNGRHRISIRPAQGKVGSLMVKIPPGFTVSDVVDGPVGSWRFDPEKQELRMGVDPAQEEAFSFLIETQRGSGTLPADLDLAPVRIDGAAGEVGMFALAFGEDVQAEGIETSGLSRINADDFDKKLIPRNEFGNALAALQHVFRYGVDAASAKLKVTAVAPEVRSDAWQLVSLGEDRLMIATDLNVEITRSGLFRLELEVPDGLEIESASGDTLSHWTEGKVDGKRIITLHLTGKTLGRVAFSLSLTGPATGSQKSWQVPRIGVRGASRETGVLTIVPERGMQVVAAQRKGVSQMDPRELAEGPQAAASASVRPGALSYRILQADWELGLAISRLSAWVTASVLQDVMIREGQVLTKAHIHFSIENAAIRTRRVRIPGLDPAAASTVRASGFEVADFIQVTGTKDLWEIVFQRGIAGDAEVEIEYHRPGKADAETIENISIPDVRWVDHYTTLRAGGRLELDAPQLPKGWQRVDASTISSLFGRAAGSVPAAMSFSVNDSAEPLQVKIQRHQLANLRKLRIAEGSLTTLLAPGGDSLTAVRFRMEVVGKVLVKMKLPADSSLFHVFVNDEGAPLVREGDDWLFHVFPSPDPNKASILRFVYSAKSAGNGKLAGPELDVPLEDLTWRVLVPEGWKLASHRGDFDLKNQQDLDSFRVEDYRSWADSKRLSDAKSAVLLLDRASALLEAGDQENAGLALGNAVRNGQLDAASGEDARVQLRALKTQQAMLGINSRRQKLAIDNRVAAPGQAGNSPLQRAAEANPILRGSYNFDPKQFDRFLDGNSAAENTALKEIANRIVTQQLAAEPAPMALDVTLPERGTLLSFTRSVQVDGNRPMGIEVHLRRDAPRIAWLAIPLCMVVAAMGVMGGRAYGNRKPAA
jgi:hypothetical protein